MSLKTCVNGSLTSSEAMRLFTSPTPSSFGSANVDITFNAANCIRQAPISPGRVLFNNYMKCMISRSCPIRKFYSISIGQQTNDLYM
jgi:hypothetical protein